MPFDSSHKRSLVPKKAGRFSLPGGVRVIVVNAEGSKQNGVALAALLAENKARFRPLVALICEADGPNGAHDRLQHGLENAVDAKGKPLGIEVFRNAAGKTHGEREVAVAVMRRRKGSGTFTTEQLTPNTNADHSQWEGDGQDRWVGIFTDTFWGKSYAFYSLHAPTGMWKGGTPVDNVQSRNWRKIGRAKLNVLLRQSASAVQVVGGDLNEQDNSHQGGTRAWGSRHGLTAVVSGLGWLLTNRALKSSQEIPLARNVSDHKTAILADLPLLRAPKPPPPPKPADPYAKTTHDGKTVDCLTDAALLEAERRLGYPLTIVQGSYNRGGVSQSAGTHDGGGAVDLSPWDWEKKVRVMRAVGFAAWHRPAIRGVWAEHIHCILIGNQKLSPAAAAQVVDYRNHRDGLAGHGPDNTWHPNPIPTFKMPKDYQPK